MLVPRRSCVCVCVGWELRAEHLGRDRQRPERLVCGVGPGEGREGTLERAELYRILPLLDYSSSPWATYRKDKVLPEGVLWAWGMLPVCHKCGPWQNASLPQSFPTESSWVHSGCMGVGISSWKRQQHVDRTVDRVDACFAESALLQASLES